MDGFYCLVLNLFHNPTGCIKDGVTVETWPCNRDRCMTAWSDLNDDSPILKLETDENDFEVNHSSCT